MPIQGADTPFSDAWWLNRLAKKLESRVERLEKLQRYYEGDPDLPVGAENAKEAYRAFQKKARLNVAELVCESVRERMIPVGFRTADGNPNGDADARQIWVDNDLDIESADVHTSMLSMGDAYVIVGPPQEGESSPTITGEDPRQVVTIHDPVRQRNIRAAAKIFHDPDQGRDFAYLYMPGEAGGRARVRVATRERNARTAMVRFNPSSWDWDEERSSELPFAEVPVVRFRNKRGVGEFEPHIDLLDRINHMLLQRLVIATFQAFRQRAIKDAPVRDEETGEVIDYEAIFTADPGALWRLPAGSEMWESAMGDLGPMLASVKDDLQYAAAVMRFPLTYISPDAAVQSAEGASLQREGLVFRAQDRLKRANGGWVDVLRLAFSWMNDEQRSRRGALEMLWEPVERYSLAERADAASKAADMPFETKYVEIWQFPPDKVARMQAQRAEDAFMASLAQPAQPALEAGATPEPEPVEPAPTP